MEQRYKSLIAFLDEDDYTEFGILFEALVGYNHRQLDEMLEFLTRCVGRINFHYIARGQTTYRSGRIVGITVEPPEMIEARMAKAKMAER
jgi:hypothetical protein